MTDPADPCSFLLEFGRELLSGGIGIFVGAWLAFAYERRGKKDDERAECVSQAKFAQMSILRQWNQMQQIQNERLNPHRVKPPPIRAISCFPASGLQPIQALNLSTLAFLLDSNGGGLLPDIALSEDKYHALFALNQTRCEFHKDVLKKFNPALNTDIEFSPADHDVAMLTKLTNEWVPILDEYLSFTTDVLERLRNELQRRFPGEAFLKLTPNDNRTSFSSPSVKPKP